MENILQENNGGVLYEYTEYERFNGKYVMPLANKLGNEIHLRAIRDAFMSLLPITFTGGIAAVLSSAPSVDAAGTGITLAWARFVE